MMWKQDQVHEELKALIEKQDLLYEGQQKMVWEQQVKQRSPNCITNTFDERVLLGSRYVSTFKSRGLSV